MGGNEISLIGTGITLGMVHVLTGPDHLSALATLSVNVGNVPHAFFLGIRWGLGHSTGLLLVGIILIFWDAGLRQQQNDADGNGNSSATMNIHVPDNVSHFFESLVGIFMLLLGAYGIQRAWEKRPKVYHYYCDFGRSVLPLSSSLSSSLSYSSSSSSSHDDYGAGSSSTIRTTAAPIEAAAGAASMDIESYHNHTMTQRLSEQHHQHQPGVEQDSRPLVTTDGAGVYDDDDDDNNNDNNEEMKSSFLHDHHHAHSSHQHHHHLFSLCHDGDERDDNDNADDEESSSSSSSSLSSSSCWWWCSRRCYSRRRRGRISARTLAVCAGIVHGLAGPGGVLGVIPAVQLHNGKLAALYLSSFCISSTLTMGLFAICYGTCSHRLGSAGLQGRRRPRVQGNQDATGTSATTTAVVATNNNTQCEFLIECISAFLSILVGITWLTLLSIGKLEDVFP